MIKNPLKKDLTYTFDHLQSCIIVYDSDSSEVRYINDSAKHVVVELGDFINENVDDEFLEKFILDIGKDFSKGSTITKAYYKEDAKLTKHFKCNKFSLLNNGEECVILELIDITELEESRQSIITLREHDVLTNLYNHRFVYDKINEYGKLSTRYNKRFTVLLMDIKEFRNINETYGHHIGDEVLIAAAESILLSIRNVDIAARYDADRFLIILPEQTAKSSEIVAKRINKKLSQLTFDKSDLELVSNISIREYEGSKIDVFITKLERMLSEAKSGDARIVL